ncbi:MAG: hypothetical protein WC683_01635 [bacterium]
MKIERIRRRVMQITYDGRSPEMEARASALALALGARGYTVTLVKA